MDYDALKEKVRALLAAEENAERDWVALATFDLEPTEEDVERIRAAAILTLGDTTRILNATTELIAFLEKR